MYQGWGWGGSCRVGVGYVGMGGVGHTGVGWGVLCRVGGSCRGGSCSGGVVKWPVILVRPNMHCKKCKFACLHRHRTKLYVDCHFRIFLYLVKKHCFTQFGTDLHVKMKQPYGRMSTERVPPMSTGATNIPCHLCHPPIWPKCLQMLIYHVACFEYLGWSKLFSWLYKD